MTRKLERVLWILDYFPRPHDRTTGTWALETIVAIRKQGVDVVVLAPTPWIPRWLALTPWLRDWSRVPARASMKGVPVYYPKCPHYPHRFVTRALYNHLPFFDSALVWWWCRQTVARIMAEYPFQVVHANFIFPGGCLGREIKRRYGIPLIVHERSPQRLGVALTHPRRRAVYAGVIREADAVITSNHEMGAQLRALAEGEDKITIIRSAADVRAAGAHRAARPRHFDGKKVVLCVGALSERKGHEHLIRAMGAIRNRVPEARCIIIGRGPRGEALARLIQELGLTASVELYGQHPHEDVLRMMTWCDVFALPSWSESSGTAYVEAMASGKPIIACEGEGLMEVVQDGIHGLLVKARDVESLARALTQLLQDDPLRVRLGGEARKLAARDLNYPAITSRMIGLYERVQR